MLRFVGCRRLFSPEHVLQFRGFHARQHLLTSKKIPREFLIISAARSGGPGGQHVNKVNTKADVRLVVKEATWLNEYTRNRLLELHKTKINKRGELVVVSTQSRSLHKNVEDAISRLQLMVDEASKPPPETSEAAKKRVAKLEKKFRAQRKQEKERRADKKGGRREGRY